VYLKFTIWAIIFLTFSTIQVLSQSITGLKAAYFAGPVLKHDNEMAHLAYGITQGAEFEYFMPSSGKKEWQHALNYPDIGASLSYYDYGADDLGQSVGLLLYARLFLKRNERFSLSARIGTGWGVHSKPYNKDTNSKNASFSSPFTFALNGALETRVNISPQWAAGVSLMISHFSFADFNKPNKGVNVVSPVFNVYYLNGQSTLDRPERKNIDPVDRTSRPLTYNACYSMGWVDHGVLDNKRYPVYMASAFVKKRFSNVSYWRLGFDLFNNTILKEEVAFIHAVQKIRKVGHKRAAVTAGYELRMGRVSAVMVLGVYVYKPYKIDPAIYQCYGLNVYVHKNVFFHYGFKTHFGNADHMELGVGVQI